MRVSQSALVVLSALALLTACQKEPEPTPPPQAQEQAPNPNPAPPAPTPTPASNPSLIREPAAPQQQQDPAAQAIQSKPFGEGTLALTKVKVVGQILNVEFMYIPPKNENGSYKFTNEHSGKITDFAYVDESTSKRISLLQDESGKYMTDPATGVSNTIGLTGNSPKIVALKFPAPPETSPTITIDFPGAGSFDSVPVSR
ncbi:phosphoribosylglycinamide synthetase [Eikenella sp. NML080894]|uniref:phosphoribosylglycinamide synthetase n=1 Tax=Eikenella TaxID=538 RepID=UPI0007DF805C|nr:MULTISPECIES: phosphoribosylglycinamide synthetase [Eikenella]OAM37705.1 phosphoribosylglycinamide synthetase [Eikenella sp. NML080894]OAM38481.1 phosphoribosylglycinamide synthetase [Eikenella sp. NML120348]OAM44656.1 phosphoribosylglycinamide synthetase [Eikenella sp. NML99-0057]